MFCFATIVGSQKSSGGSDTGEGWWAGLECSDRCVSVRSCAPGVWILLTLWCSCCRMSELIEKETEEYRKGDPDPFDDRHPGKVSWVMLAARLCPSAYLVTLIQKQTVFSLNVLTADRGLPLLLHWEVVLCSADRASHSWFEGNSSVLMLASWVGRWVFSCLFRRSGRPRVHAWSLTEDTLQEWWFHECGRFALRTLSVPHSTLLLLFPLCWLTLVLI